MGIVLFLISVLLNLFLALPALLHTVFGAFRYKGKFTYVNDAFLNAAEALDVFGNVAYGTFLNDLFLNKGGYHYGQGRETVSSATGKNWVLGKLSFLGKGLAGTLNLIDRDHCWKYLEGDRRRYDVIGKPDPVPIFYTISFIAFSAAGLYTLFRLLLWTIW